MTSGLVAESGKWVRGNAARDIMASEMKERSTLSDQRQAAAGVLATLKSDAAGNGAKTAIAAAERGPVREIAAPSVA